MSNPSNATENHGAHGSLKSYAVGFALSLITTLAAFWMVMSGAMARGAILPGIVLLAVVQLLIQLVYFLHMGSASSDQRENRWVLVFTLLILTIIVAGSLWVLHNMNVNMMPGAHGDMGGM